jgi:hypothetical protein
MNMKRTLLAVFALIVVVAACGGAGLEPGATTTTTQDSTTSTTTGAPSTTLPPVDPDALVLEVKRVGGFAPIELIYNPGPVFSLYGDGTLLFEGPIPEIYPGPLVVPFQKVQLTQDQMARVMAAIDDAGLPGIRSEDLRAADNVADAQDTVFTYFDGAEHTMSIYALGISDPQKPAVAPYADLHDLLVALTFSATPQTVDAERYQIIITGSFGGEDDEFASVQPSPLATPIADIPMTGVRELQCIVVAGDEAATLTNAFKGANQLTFFEDAGVTYRFIVRPLAPHEAGCPG